MSKWVEKGKNIFKKHGAIIIFGVGLFLIDRLSKIWALSYLQFHTIQIFPFFQLHYLENTGTAFGMLQNSNFLLILVMLAIIAYMIKQWKELCSYGKLVKIGCIFILAGALGNLYDRIFLGYVVDFLDFMVWPVFNVADSWVTIGGSLFVISLIYHKGNLSREEK